MVKYIYLNNHDIGFYVVSNHVGVAETHTHTLHLSGVPVLLDMEAVKHMKVHMHAHAKAMT